MPADRTVGCEASKLPPALAEPFNGATTAPPDSGGLADAEDEALRMLEHQTDQAILPLTGREVL